MTTKIIVWRDSVTNELSARLIREELLDIANGAPLGADIIYIACTNTQENDEKILRHMVISELKRPTPRCITVFESGEIWKF